MLHCICTCLYRMLQYCQGQNSIMKEQDVTPQKKKVPTDMEDHWKIIMHKETLNVVKVSMHFNIMIGLQNIISFKEEGSGETPQHLVERCIQTQEQHRQPDVPQTLIVHFPGVEALLGVCVCVCTQVRNSTSLLTKLGLLSPSPCDVYAESNCYSTRLFISLFISRLGTCIVKPLWCLG